MMKAPQCSQFDAVADFIKSHGSFAILSHLHPDGDAIGSTLALGEALKNLGKRVVMMNEDGVPDYLAFMPGAEQIAQSTEAPVDVEAVISVDCGAVKRLGERSLKAVGQDKPWANIDHHETNDKFGVAHCIMPDESATGGVLFKLFKHMGVEITPIMRDALYVAISTDTGSFQYGSTTAETMEQAAELIRLGVDVAEINRLMYHEDLWVKIKLAGEVLNGMQLSHDGRIASFGLTKESMTRLGCRPEDTEGMSNYLRRVKGVWVTVYLEESPGDPRVRISLRSKNKKISVAALAQRYGGGGHAMAAGIRMVGDIEEVRKMLVAAAQEEVDRIAAEEQ